MINKNFTFLKPIIVFLLFIQITSSILAQNTTEIVLTIDYMTTNEESLQFKAAENLRKDFKYQEAIIEYEKILQEKADLGEKATAAYNIGLCYTWLNDFEEANKYFLKVIDEYNNNPLAVSFSKYGLSWIKVKEGKYYEAIDILQNELDNNISKDFEHSAVMQFKIGKIYKKYLHMYEDADKIFKELLVLYPDAEIIKHPYLDYLRKN